MWGILIRSQMGLVAPASRWPHGPPGWWRHPQHSSLDTRPCGSTLPNYLLMFSIGGFVFILPTNHAVDIRRVSLLLWLRFVKKVFSMRPPPGRCRGARRLLRRPICASTPYESSHRPLGLRPGANCRRQPFGFRARSYLRFSWRQRGEARKFFRFFRIYRSQAEVQHLHLTIGHHLYVGRLQVPV